MTGLIHILFIFGHENEMKYLLIFAYSDVYKRQVQYLERIKETKKLEYKSKKTYEQILYEEKVEIISSDKCGLEKNQLK